MKPVTHLHIMPEKPPNCLDVFGESVLSLEYAPLNPDDLVASF